jgi:acetyltransferase-like isoleucine patch superfamily enzyme
MSKFIVFKPFAVVVSYIKRAWRKYITANLIKSQMGRCGKDVTIRFKDWDSSFKRIELYDDVFIADGFKFISYAAKLIMKSHSNAATNFTVVTGNHGRVVGRFIKDTEKERSNEQELDVVVEEDVEIGSDVTLLAGVHVGRGAAVGSGSVVRTNVPPYSIVIGNPAKIVGFTFTPEQVIEHEKVLYPENERLPLDKLEKTYKKFFLDRMKEIRSFTSL